MGLIDVTQRVWLLPRSPGGTEAASRQRRTKSGRSGRPGLRLQLGLSPGQLSAHQPAHKAFWKLSIRAERAEPPRGHAHAVPSLPRARTLWYKKKKRISRNITPMLRETCAGGSHSLSLLGPHPPRFLMKSAERAPSVWAPWTPPTGGVRGSSLAGRETPERDLLDY